MPVDILQALDEVLEARRSASADSSYVASLHAKGLNRILEKVGEEATEVILAARDMQDARSQGGELQDATQALVGEVADLWFHTLIMLSNQGLQSADVLACLEQRFGLSGHTEKAARHNSEP